MPFDWPRLEAELKVAGVEKFVLVDGPVDPVVFGNVFVLHRKRKIVRIKER